MIDRHEAVSRALRAALDDRPDLFCTTLEALGWRLVPLRPEPLVRGPLRLDPGAGLCEWFGQSVPLSPKLARFAAVLAASPGPVTYDEMERRVYDDPGAQYAGRGRQANYMNLRTMVKKLRSAFRAVDPAFDSVRTVWGVGLAWEDVR